MAPTAKKAWLMAALLGSGASLINSGTMFDSETTYTPRDSKYRKRVRIKPELTSKQKKARNKAKAAKKARKRK